MAGDGPRRRRRGRSPARRPGRHAEPAADVDLGDRVAVGQQARGDPRRPSRGPPRTRQAVAPSQPEPAWKWIVSIVRSVAGRRLERLRQVVLVDAELRRAVAAVREPGVVAGAGGRVDPKADRRTRRPPPESLDLADRVEIDVDRLGQEDVQVALGDVRAGVADLVGPPAALEGAGRPRPASRRRCRRAAGGPRGSAAPGWPSARTEADGGGPTDPSASSEPARVLGEPGPVIDEQRRAVSRASRSASSPAIVRRPSPRSRARSRTHHGAGRRWIDGRGHRAGA